MSSCRRMRTDAEPFVAAITSRAQSAQAASPTRGEPKV
eukprot:CAMPEP_0195599286 /NCGR_PEP_ID=MMETSP0815-20121206/3954_1 /TAXON_ID=97485 /ORGANISM="Prymnesium parvum, Strain Texoma1" /LENGTH=37 /DNA_ID= /DNA_START= /DNA_END= /DNA_ORIENTATION=